MTVEEALELLRERSASIRGKLQTLHDVGLGYIRLGQPATTLSGGEAQRIKLARELSRRDDRAARSTCSTSRRPACTSTTCASCSTCCSAWSTLGNTVVVIEHNLDVIKTADWIIDLGPEGGARRRRVVAWGTPEEVAAECRELHGAVPAAAADRLTPAQACVVTCERDRRRLIDALVGAAIVRFSAGCRQPCDSGATASRVRAPAD